MTDETQITREFWDRLYDGFVTPGEGDPNRYLVSEAENLALGTALDLGCAHGADAIWLARRGWQVTAVDVSDIALERARQNAAEAGVADRIRFVQHDLGTRFPAGTFDLVSAQFLHSPVAAPGERERILQRAAEAVTSGGHLLVVSHQSVPAWHPGMPEGLTEHPLNLAVPSAEENIAALHLTDGNWKTVRQETVAIELSSPTGQPGVREDQVLHYQRTAAA